MRRCIRSILLTVLMLNCLLESAQATCLYPLFSPLHWFCGWGHHNPYATRRFIDDWLGYGYLRGNEDGSLGHYPLKPWNCYAPMYPRLQAPLIPRMPMPAPMTVPAPMPAPMPMPMPMPYQSTPWNIAPPSDGCGCGGTMTSPMPVPQSSGGDCCSPCDVCDPCQQMPYPVQVPITTYRPVTVDRGAYQMVWVPRPVTQWVPQTSWQTQYMRPNYGYQPLPQMPMQMQMPVMPAPMMQPYSMPAGGGCCGASSMDSHDATAFVPQPGYSGAMPTAGYAYAPGSAAAWQHAPLYGNFSSYTTANTWGMRPAYPQYQSWSASAWSPPRSLSAYRSGPGRYSLPMTAQRTPRPVPLALAQPVPLPAGLSANPAAAWQNPYAWQANTAAPYQTAYAMPYQNAVVAPYQYGYSNPYQTAYASGYPMTASPVPSGLPGQWSAEWPGAGYPAGQTAMGDVWGDHEGPSSASAAMLPVVPNAWQQSVPLSRNTPMQPFRSISVNRYPHVVR